MSIKELTSGLLTMIPDEKCPGWDELASYFVVFFSSQAWEFCLEGGVSSTDQRVCGQETPIRALKGQGIASCVRR